MGDTSNSATAGSGQENTAHQSHPVSEIKSHNARYDKTAAEQDLVAHSQRQAPVPQQIYSQSGPPPPYAQSSHYDMTAMMSNLPPIAYRQSQFPHHIEHRYAIASPSPVPQQYNHPAPYGMPSVLMAQHGYYLHHTHISPPIYGASQMEHALPPQRQNVGFHPDQVLMNRPHSAFYYQPSNQYPTQPPMVPLATAVGPYTAGRPTSPSSHHFYHPFDRVRPQTAASHGQTEKPSVRIDRQGAPAMTSTTEQGSRQGACPAPRKPRQKGHAIWIGNLPSQTDLMSLVNYVCKETTGLESLFLISKSNCAFANFQNEKACMAAQHKLHDAKFQFVRLVSRLRKSTAEGGRGLAAQGKSATRDASATTEHPPAGDKDATKEADKETSTTVSQPVKSRSQQTESCGSQRDKYFILKSLTVEDLELSVQTGVWATQPHNEAALNNAFKTFENIYLIFSANKSGEYFGYARMTSEINEDPAAAIKFAPKAQGRDDLVMPRTYTTEATEYAPKGRVIDDSARGTIFWEAEREEAESEIDDESDVLSNASSGTEEETTAWGKPFQLEWLSTSRLPFYRTRGLRNPWNSNREVKIARDGTELEPSVGRKVIGLFNRAPSPGTLAPGTRPPVVGTGMPGVGPSRRR